MANALIVVDVQKDFCEGGALGVDGGNAVAAKVAELLAADHGYDHVIATRDHHIDPGDHFSATPDYVDSWPPHCVVGTPGQEFHEQIRDYDFDAIFDKGSYEAAYSGFEGTIGGDENGKSLTEWLREHDVEQIDVCGIATDFCVFQTAVDGVQEDFDVTVLGSLSAAIHKDQLDQLIQELLDSGITYNG